MSKAPSSLLATEGPYSAARSPPPASGAGPAVLVKLDVICNRLTEVGFTLCLLKETFSTNSCTSVAPIAFYSRGKKINIYISC